MKNDILKTGNQARCDNWVGFLQQNGFLKQYAWYYGIGSICDEESIILENRKAMPYMNRALFDENTINNINNIDMIFISISPQWIPINQYNLIELFLVDLPEEKIQFIKKPFFDSAEEKSFLTMQCQKSSLSRFEFLNKYS